MSERYPFCGVCMYRESDACEECEEADMFELDEDLIEEYEEDRMAVAA